MNIHQVSKINLSPDIVDCIVFWSKNPQPMIEKLSTLKDYMYYFQFTLNAYEEDIETNLPPLSARIDTFQALSDLIGKNRVIWRYDPIIVNDKYSINWHIKKFKYLTEQLCHYTEKVTISFIDLYTKIPHNIKGKSIYELSFAQKDVISNNFAEIAHLHNLVIDTCAEDIDLSSYSIEHARCIDDRLISKLLHCSIGVEKDKNQRLECGCIAYCYANHNCAIRTQNFQSYDPFSPLLCSHITETDKIIERKVKSQKNMQLSLFDI